MAGEKSSIWDLELEGSSFLLSRSQKDTTHRSSNEPTMTMKVPSLLYLTLLPLLLPFSVVASTNPTGECLPVNDNEFNCFPIDGVVECENDHPNCDEWAKKNECKRNAQYMIYNCRKSCETCVR